MSTALALDAKNLYKRALRHATAAIRLVKPVDFARPTPDSEWDVLTLARHMLYELCWTADILQGKSIMEVGDKYEGEIVAGDLDGNWLRAADAAVRAIDTCDLDATAHLSYADVTNEYYLQEAASDQLVHAWDLSMAVGEPVIYDRETASAVFERTLPRLKGMAASGLFAPPLSVSDDADIQTRLLALYGRDANWLPGS